MDHKPPYSNVEQLTGDDSSNDAEILIRGNFPGQVIGIVRNQDRLHVQNAITGHVFFRFFRCFFVILLNEAISIDNEQPDFSGVQMGTGFHKHILTVHEAWFHTVSVDLYSEIVRFIGNQCFGKLTGFKCLFIQIVTGTCRSLIDVDKDRPENRHVRLRTGETFDRCITAGFDQHLFVIIDHLSAGAVQWVTAFGDGTGKSLQAVSNVQSVTESKKLIS